MIRVTPRGGKDAIDGVRCDDAGRALLAARVAATPAGGAATAAALALLARRLGVARGDVTLEAGASARIKRVVISGDPATLTAALERIADEETGR